MRPAIAVIPEVETPMAAVKFYLILDHTVNKTNMDSYCCTVIFTMLSNSTLWNDKKFII